MPTNWTCTITDASTTACTVTAYTVSTTTISATSTVPYGDWMFVNAWIIFFLAFVPLTALFSLFRTKKR